MFKVRIYYSGETKGPVLEVTWKDETTIHKPEKLNLVNFKGEWISSQEHPRGYLEGYVAKIEHNKDNSEITVYGRIINIGNIF